MNKTFWTKSRILAIALSGSAFVWMLVVYIFILCSKGFIGWVTWEYLGVAALVGLTLLVILPLAFFVLSIFKEKAHKPTKIVSGVSMGVSLAATLFLVIGGNLSGLKANLNFYASKDGTLSNGDVSIAVASDSHWGAKSSNATARNAIMDTIEASPYDLMIHGGDVVDLGFVKSYYQEAIKDMETHLPTQKVHFVMGNHDALVNGENNFRKVFQPGETSLNHVLELAPKVHWVVFNMIWDNSEVKTSDVNWLKETLAKYPSSDCVVVQTHSYYFATGNRIGMAKWYDIDNVVQTLTPIFEQNNVDLVVSGHIHTMQMMKQNNVNYALVGPFGGSRYNDRTIETKAQSTFLDGTHYGFASFDIHQVGTIDVNFRDEHGASLHSASIAY